MEFLSRFDRPIDFLYLDSWDFDFADPAPSQQHHLREIIAAYPRLHAQSMVLIDDCNLPHGGKGRLVIQYLAERGWRVLHSEYQTLLVRD